jgi:allantoinase
MMHRTNDCLSPPLDHVRVDIGAWLVSRIARHCRVILANAGANVMLPRQRSSFSAIIDRPPLKLSDGARIIVWTIVNLEFWSISRPMARQVLPAPTGEMLLPDVPNWSWHEYGMRVGVWRFFKLFERLGIRPTLSINARVCEEYPRVAQAARSAGWEFMGHAWEQMPIHKVESQAAMIGQSLDTLERFTGSRPVGWLGPGLTETYETPDLLTAAGTNTSVIGFTMTSRPRLAPSTAR